MAKKDNHRRLTIPKDIWSILNLTDEDRTGLGFFITDDHRVCITLIHIGLRNDFEYVSKCTIDYKHRVVIPDTIDNYLGDGDFYYFTAQINREIIYLYKLGDKTIQEIQKENFFKSFA